MPNCTTSDAVVGVPANDFIYLKVVPLPERCWRRRQHQQDNPEGMLLL